MYMYIYIYIYAYIYIYIYYSGYMGPLTGPSDHTIITTKKINQSTNQTMWEELTNLRLVHFK